MLEDLIEAIVRFCKRLEAAEIRYLIGGSVASGLWGEPRQTNDADVEVWVSFERAEAFMNAFDAGYIVSRDELYDAIESKRPFASVQMLDVSAILDRKSTQPMQ